MPTNAVVSSIREPSRFKTGPASPVESVDLALVEALLKGAGQGIDAPRLHFQYCTADLSRNTPLACAAGHEWPFVWKLLSFPAGDTVMYWVGSEITFRINWLRLSAAGSIPAASTRRGRHEAPLPEKRSHSPRSDRCVMEDHLSELKSLSQRIQPSKSGLPKLRPTIRWLPSCFRFPEWGW